MNWSSKIITHRGNKRIAVYFEKNAELIARIKLVEGSRWSQTMGVWHLPDTEENRIRFKLIAYVTHYSFGGRNRINREIQTMVAFQTLQRKHGYHLQRSLEIVLVFL